MIMDCEYFKSHIQEELDGAAAYAKAAMETKGDKPAWSKKFVEMAAAEMQHAKYFYEMFIEHYSAAVKPYTTEIPKRFRDLKSEIADLYMDCSAQTRAMLELVQK